MDRGAFIKGLGLSFAIPILPMISINKKGDYIALHGPVRNTYSSGIWTPIGPIKFEDGLDQC